MGPATFFAATALAGARHPCTPAEDLGPGRYVRRSVVVFPLEVAEDGWVVQGTWSGTAPDGTRLEDPKALVASVAAGLFAVDWPLRRFDAWYATRSPVLDDIGVLEQDDRALRCTDAAVIPKVAGAEITVADGSARVKVALRLEVYQRDEQGRLAPTDYLEASAPGLVDSVEDAMLTARRQSVDRVMEALPVKKKTLDRAGLASDVVLELLPDGEAAKVEAMAKQTALAATRVASVARPAVVLPTLDPGAENPGVGGLQWRAEEERCYLEPPDDEDPERILVCATLSRVRQAVRELQLQTRRIEGFRLTGPVVEDGTPLGDAEGLEVGDGYWLYGADGRVGYSRVRRVGAGGVDGGSAPSRLQVVYGPRGAAGLTVREHPQLGIEIGGSGGILPASRPESALPDDPIDGGTRALGAAALAPAGTLRFDVNLGRTAGLYEWYQTNRLARGLAGPLQHTAATFGLERRVQVLPRTSFLLGAGVSVGTWSVPSGEVKIGEDGDPSELRASATRIGGEGEAGLSFVLSPNLLVRATAGGRVAGRVEEFSWSDGDRGGTVVPAPVDGSPFRLGTSGLVAAVSTSWTF